MLVIASIIISIVSKIAYIKIESKDINFNHLKGRKLYLLCNRVYFFVYNFSIIVKILML